MLSLLRKERFLIVSLFLSGIISRLPFLEKMQSHWDGPDYTLGILHYSLIERTPSPPGYPLYIFAGKVMHSFFTDPHTAILLVSVVFAGVGAIVFYLAGKIIFNKTVGVVSSLLFLSAPSVFYFGITANPYGILPSTAAVVSLVVFMIIKFQKKYGVLLGLVFAFALGIRPQDALFLTPLFILGFFYLSNKQRILSLIGFLALFIIWFLPLVMLSGGIGNYLNYIDVFARNDARVDFSVQRFFYIAPIIVKGAYLTCGFGLLFLLFLLSKAGAYLTNPKKLVSKKVKPYFLVFSFWLIPALAFNFLVRSDHAAHQMAYLSALVLLCSFCITKVVGKKAIVVALIIVILNLFTFFRDRDIQKIMPYVSQSFHYSEIVKNDVRMKSISDFINAKFSSENTIVIADPEIFRQSSYYLMNFNVFAYGALDTSLNPHRDIVHHSYLGHYKLSYDKTHKLVIPPKVTEIILINNNREVNLPKSSFKKHILEGNAVIYSIRVLAGEKYLLSVHQIERIIR